MTRKTNYNLPDKGSAKWHSSPLYPAVFDLSKRTTRVENRQGLNDDEIAAASALAAAAHEQALAALTAAEAAQAAADGAIRTYYTPNPPWPNGAPTADANLGDMWFDTDTGVAHRWDGDSWEAIQDASITAALAAAQNAQTTADGKITAYYQTSQPWANADPAHDDDVGDLWYDTDAGNKAHYYDGTFWTALPVGKQALAPGAVSSDIITSDGSPPSTSPVPTVIGGIGALYTHWTPITNADPVEYEVHVSATTGFTHGPTTRATVTAGASHTIRALPDGSPLEYGVTYFVKIVAKDDDGSAAPSTEASDQMVPATTPDIATSYIYAGTVLVDQLRGGTLVADILMGATISTRVGGVGAGVDISPFGIVTYDSDNTPVIVLPSNGDEIASIKAEVEAQGLTVTGKAAFRAADNEIAPSGGLILQSAVTAPQSPPSVVVDWPGFPLTGTPVDMTKVYSCTWISDGTMAGFQITERYGTSGYMIRNFDPDGSYDQTRVFESVTDPNTAHGAGFEVGNTRYIVEHITDLNWVYIRKQDGGTVHAEYYDRINTSQLPVIGWDGTNILIAEYDATNNRFRIQTMDPTTMLLTGSTMLTTSQGGFSGPLYGVVRGNFDFGVSRTIVLAKNAVHAWVFNSSGTYQPNEAFPVKVADSRGLTWDGTRFWTLTASGSLTKHAPAAWNDAFDPQTWYTCATWRDTDSTGGLHETDMGPVASFQMRRRAWLTLTSGTIPDQGGTDDADAPGFFVGKVNSTRTNLWRQTDPAAGVKSVTYETITFTGSNPPASNDFPPANPAFVKSRGLDAEGQPAWQFKGDGSGRMGGVSLSQMVYAERARHHLQGAGLRKVTATGVSWDARLLVGTGAGLGGDIGTSGYFDISQPPDDTVITGVGGLANQTVTAGVVPVPAWAALFYILPLGTSGTFTSLPANFRVATYTAALEVPPHWVLVCIHSGEARSPAYIWGDGQQQDVWRNLTLSGSFVAYNASWTPGYKKENGLIMLRGLTKTGTTGTVAVLPAGFRPGQQFVFATKAGSTMTPGSGGSGTTTITSRVDVLADGTISAADNGTPNATFLSLFGITFPAEN